MGFSHGRRKAAATTVKASGLKDVSVEVKFESGAWYSPIPHNDVLARLQRRAADRGVTLLLRGSVVLHDDGTTMVATLIGETDKSAQVCVRPTVTVASSHDGRQPVEAFFGYDVRAKGGADYAHLVPSKLTVQQRHTRHADLSEWADRVLDVFARGGTDEARKGVSTWCQSLAGSKMSDASMFYAVSTAVAARPRNPSRKTTGPFMAADCKTIQQMFESDSRGGWPKHSRAAFLYLASKLIDTDERPIRAIWRRQALLLATGPLPGPFDSYAE